MALTAEIFPQFLTVLPRGRKSKIKVAGPEASLFGLQMAASHCAFMWPFYLCYWWCLSYYKDTTCIGLGSHSYDIT